MLLILSSLRTFVFLLMLGLSDVYGSLSFIQERPDIFEKIAKSFNKNNCINFYGLSGMGKTYLVKEFAKKWIKDGGISVSLVWDPNSIDEQVENALKVFKYPVKKSSSISMFINAIKATKKILVIVDNYNEESEVLLKQKIPGLLDLKNAKILIVSQEKLRLMGIQCPPFTPTEAISLMKKYLPGEEEEKIKKIAELFSYYPYYIVTICKFLTTSNTFDITRTQEDIAKKSAGRFLMENVSLTNQNGLQKEIGPSVVCKMLSELREQTPEVFEALGFLSCLASKNIPLQLIQLFIGDDKKADQIIESLISKSLISCVNKNSDFISYDIHDISREIVSGELTQQEKKAILEKGVKAFCLFFKQNFTKVYDLNREDQVFYSHVTAFLEFFKSAPEDVLSLHVLALKRSLYSRRNHEIAQEDLLQLEILNPEVKISDPDILFEYYIARAFINCFNHADDTVIFNKGRYLVLKAIRLAEDEKDNEKIFKACTRLVWIHLYAGDLGSARPYLEKARALLPKITVPCSLKEFYFIASWFFIEEGNFDEAYLYTKEGVKIDEVSKNANIGIYLRINQAFCEYRFKKYQDAFMTVRDALERESAIFGSEKSLARAELLQIESLIFIENGEPDQAEISIRESLAIFAKIRGNNAYLPYAQSMKILADVLLCKKKVEEAKDVMVSSLNMFKILIKDSPTFEFGEAFVLMGKILLLLGDFEKLHSTYKELETRFGKDNENTKKLFSIITKANKAWLIG